MEEHKDTQIKGISISPNPFQDRTTINYTLKSPERVNLSIYDAAGNLIKIINNRWQTAGTYKVIWDGRNQSNKKVALGIYLVILKNGVKQYKEKLIKF